MMFLRIPIESQSFQSFTDFRRPSPLSPVKPSHPPRRSKRSGRWKGPVMRDMTVRRVPAAVCQAVWGLRGKAYRLLQVLTNAQFRI